ncbi:CRISPR-associated helicase Cas3' [Defluviimonas sp. SAOS-178_SWC]|uniref:CRISPR-associated helicase Cas3' n=1 Tax=Defluviimonas sp. SAOS-178_SWC TaxID=3121287 RepID=UPI0032216E2B
MLDVSAVAAELWPGSALAGLPDQQRNALLLMIALHDLGKISAAFRRQIEQNEPPPQHCRHWELSEVLLSRLDALLAGFLGGTPTARKILRQAVAGHHGRPVESLLRPGQMRRFQAIGAEALSDAEAALRLIALLFAPASLEGIDEHAARRQSWLLSGLVTEADWIGSNSDWFQFADPGQTLAEYWPLAQARAKIAVAKSGLGLSRPRVPDPTRLVSGALRPMQAAVADAVLPEGPMLALIEDATGSGKTEAALILAQRMLSQGKGRGIFFALPSMASSDAMFTRMRGQLGRIFEGHPSLALAHGQRKLNTEFAALCGKWYASEEEFDAEDACAPWIADDRRLSLLAEISVGTVDQALMSVLPTRFHTLRMAALATRILIVDEAHDYDPYMETELKALLRFHAMFGGSAIVMTATLPTRMRDGYANAFLSGRGGGEVSDLPHSYPALSLIGRSVSAGPVAPVPETCRRVEVVRLAAMEDAVTVIAEGVAAGAACVWVRNAVDDAIAAVEALRGAGIAADLLHARFAMGDRAAIEADMLRRFGRDGQGRAGRVLVATQIVQASLDLDFDLMVSDLAPMGDLIQRAGRLWRHARGARPVPGPRLHLLTPDPERVETARWIFETQPSGGWVYPSDVLWRTARALLREGGIEAPGRLRDLIAEAYGDVPEVPEPLRQAGIEREGQGLAEAAQARLNVLNPTRHYGESEGAFEDDRKYPTRLGQDQVVLILMRREGNGLRPWIADEVPFRAQALSEVQISRRRYEMSGLEAEQARPGIAALRAGWKDWELAVRKIAVVEVDGRIAGGLRYDATRGLLREAPEGRG